MKIFQEIKEFIGKQSFLYLNILIATLAALSLLVMPQFTIGFVLGLYSFWYLNREI